MRYPEEITREVRGEEPDKKRWIAAASTFRTRSQICEFSICPGAHQSFFSSGTFGGFTGAVPGSGGGLGGFTGVL